MDSDNLIAYLDGLPEDRFVLHGAREWHSILRPFIPNQPSLIHLYNQCAVYGTCCTEIALLYAVIHEDSRNWGWKIHPEKTPCLCVYGPLSLKGGRGYIHILKREDFTSVIGAGLVCFTSHSVVPIEVIEVEPTILEILQRKKRLQCL